MQIAKALGSKAQPSVASLVLRAQSYKRLEVTIVLALKPVEHFTTSQCRRCVPKHLTVYFSYTLSLSSSKHGLPSHCPTCASRPASVRRQDGTLRLLTASELTTIAPFDYADTLCFDNAAMSRQQATKAMEAAYTLQSRAHTNHAASRITTEGLLSEVGSASIPSLKRLSTPLQVTCVSSTGCGGSYIFYRNLPDIQRTPPLYCVWCGQAGVTVVPCDTEDTAWFTLAQHYNLPVSVMQVLYNFWTKQPGQTFSTFMSSELVSTVLATTDLEAADQAQQAQSQQSQQPELPIYKDYGTPAADTVPLPSSADSQVSQPISQYNTCGICGCEQPKVLINRVYKANLAPYCEPCTIHVNRQRQLARQVQPQ